jgi:putative toxin-antitoxin system antitoxin component (TIGR02293 family)
MNHSSEELEKLIRLSEEGNSRRLSSYDYPTFLSDNFSVVNALKVGVPLSLFKEVRAYCTITDQQWALLFDISYISLRRHLNLESHIFKSCQGEKIFHLMDTTLKGLRAFESREKFSNWLNASNYTLRGEKPIELMSTSFGKQLVDAKLNNIEFGVFI